MFIFGKKIFTNPKIERSQNRGIFKANYLDLISQTDDSFKIEKKLLYVSLAA